MIRLNDPRRAQAKTSGFTLIEIVLVLAIAGLLLVVVFLAMVGAQRSRRDYQRKQYVSMMVGALDQYFAAHHAYPDPAVPGTVASFEAQFLPKGYDPSTGLMYSFANGNFDYRGIGGPHDAIPPLGSLYVEYAHWCNHYGNGDSPDDPIAGDDTKPWNFAVWVSLENGGTYCADDYQP